MMASLGVGGNRTMKTSWKHIKTIVDSESFAIDGLNIWDYEWKDTGQKVDIQDPLYNQNYTLPIYEITDNTMTAKFAAGEFSNLIWGIYQESK